MGTQATLALREAFERFDASITQEDRDLFRVTTFDDVIDEIDKTGRKARIRRLMLTRRLGSLTRWLDRYFKVPSDIFHTGNPCLSLIWAPIKLTLMVTVDNDSAFERFSEAYGRLSDAVPRIDALPEFSWWDDGSSLAILSLVYAEILEFHRCAYSLLHRKLWARSFSYMWPRLKSRFDAIESNIEYYRLLLEVRKDLTAVDISEAVSRSRTEREGWDNQERRGGAKRLRRVLSWLHSDDFRQDIEREKHLRACVPGSCDWFLQHRTVQSWWKSDTEHGLVWLHGKPGSGKSVLCSKLVQYGEKDVKANVFSCFCPSFWVSADTLSFILRSVTVQIMQKHQDLVDYVYDTYEQSKGFVATPDALLRLVPELLMIVGNAYLIIDAIDEYDSIQEINFPQNLLSTLSVLSSSRICKVLVSSRDVPAISRCLHQRNGRVTTISLADERDAIDQSIAKFVDAKLSNLPVGWWDRQPGNLARRTLRRTLLDKSDGMFLWVALVLDSLVSGYSREDPRTLLETLPYKTLPYKVVHLYKNILHRLRGSCDSENYKRVTKIFSRICFARKPLPKFELLRGITTAPSNILLVPDVLTPQILDLCKPLIEIRPDSTVVFVHFTVREYLLNFDRTGIVQRTQDEVNTQFAPVTPLNELYALSGAASKVQKIPDSSTPILSYLQPASKVEASGYTNFEPLEEDSRVDAEDGRNQFAKSFSDDLEHLLTGGEIDHTPMLANDALINLDTSSLPLKEESVDPSIQSDFTVSTYEASFSKFSSKGYSIEAPLSTLPSSLHEESGHTTNSEIQNVQSELRSKGDTDIRSLLSAEDNGESRSVMSDAGPDQRRNEIINGIVIVLATNATLIPLYEKAFELVPKHRLVNNFRRLLKVFRNGLTQSPKDRVTQELISLLSSKDTLKAIANRVVERQESPTNSLSKEDMARFQGSDESTLSKLERIFMRGEIPPSPPSEPSPPPPDALEDSDDDGGDSGDDDYENREEKTMEPQISQRPRVDQVIHTLVTSQPFQDIISGLQEFLLPPGLLHDILPIPRDTIQFSTSEKVSFLNSVQNWLENITDLEWNWWPLAPPMHPLLEGETRVYWRCYCGTVRWRTLKAVQKDLLVAVLRQPPTISRRPLLCASLYSHKTCTNSQSRPLRTSTGQPHDSSISPSKIIPLTTISSTTGNSNPPSQSIQSTKISQPSNGTSSAPTNISAIGSYQQKRPLWFIFKIEGPRSMPVWAQFGDADLGSDRVFQKKLRQEHHRLRGRLRMWFSYWRLSYWEFVKLQKTRPGRLVDRGIDLPDSLEYDYSPRPPKITAQDPWISRHEFEEIVASCITPCWLKSVPNLLGIHDCACPEEDATRIVGALPKRCSEFKVNDSSEMEDYLWGIHARYVVSAIRVLGIHVAILVVTLGLWVWWQRRHPDDMQGASVPLTVAGICISMFWSSTGILKGLR